MTEYPATRRVMGPIRERLDDEALEALLDQVFPDTGPEHVEDFMQTLQQFGRQAAPVLQRAAPGIAQGAAQGAALGPYGALFGALAGGTSALLQGGGGARTQPGPPPGPVGAPPLPQTGAPIPLAAPSPTGALQVPPGSLTASGANPASAQLLALLSQPETMQALLALVMGQYGRSSVPMGSRQVPPAAFANAIAEIASEAALAGAESDAYWYDPHGAPRCNVTSPRERAQLMLADLAEAVAERSILDANARITAVDADAGTSEALELFEAIVAGSVPDDN